MPPLNFPFNIQDFLSDVPEASFFNRISPFAFTPARQQFLRSQFQPLQNQFAGQLGGQVRSGQLPTLNFDDFLGLGLGGGGGFSAGAGLETLFGRTPPGQRPGGRNAAFLSGPNRFFF